MGVVQKEFLLDRLSEMYPEFTRKSLKGLVNFGTRKLIHILNTGENVLINGDTSKEYDGMLFCEDTSFANHIKKEKENKLKRLNRNRVKKFNSKNK